MPDYEPNPPLEGFRKRQPPTSAAYAPFDTSNPRSIQVTIRTGDGSATAWVTPGEARSLLQDIDNALTADYRASQAAVVKAQPPASGPLPAASGGKIVTVCRHCLNDIELTAGDLLTHVSRYRAKRETAWDPPGWPLATLDARDSAPWRHVGTGSQECQ